MDSATLGVKEWHPVQLPSLGLYYGDRLPEGRVQVTPWTTAQEEAVARYSDSQDMTKALVENNVTFAPGFTYSDLLLFDAFFLLIQLRIVSLCSSYTFNFNCPSCKKLSETRIDLSQVPVIVPDSSWPMEPVVVDLPKSKKKVGLRFLRVGDMDKLKEIIKSGGQATAHKRARMISDINGSPAKYEERLDLVRSIPLLDIRKIENCLSKWDMGYKLSRTETCSVCGHESEVGIPMDPRFFRPTDEDIEREAQLG